MRNVLFVSPYAVWAPHWETDLELAQRHLDAGDRVVFATCGRQLSICDPNPANRRSLCLACVGRQRSGLALLEGNFSTEPLPLEPGGIPEVAPPESIDGFPDLKVDNFDIGWAVLSSLSTWYADPRPDISDPEISRRLRVVLSESARMYYGMRNRLKRGDIDLVYVFNGRFATMRAAVRACEDLGIEYRTHDRGCDHDHFAVFHSCLPHDRIALHHQIVRKWEARSEPDRSKLASMFYEERREGLLRAWRPFVSGQEPGRLPDGWDASRRNVVMFSSSEDEWVAVGEQWVNHLYRTQLDAVRRIAEGLAALGDADFYVRMHPNGSGNSSRSVSDLRVLRAPGLQVVAPESPCSTYAMLDAADVVVTLGSTMGIEAAYWGKPSILAGRAEYSGLGSVYEPESHEELMALLSNRSLAPLDRLGAMMYGFHEQTRGEPFRYYRSTGLFEGYFKGKQVRPGLLYRVLAPVGRFARRLRNRANRRS